MQDEGRVRFRVVASEDGLMLRQLLPRRLRGLTPQAASDLVKAGGVLLGNVRVRIPTIRVAAGERVTVFPAAAAARPLDPEELRVVRQGVDYVIVDKPAGVPVSAAEAARGTLAAALVARLARGGLQRPYVGAVQAAPTCASGLCLFTVRGQDTQSFHRLFADAPIAWRARARLAGEAPPELACDLAVVTGPSGHVRVASDDRRGAAAPARTHLRRLAVDGAGEAAASHVEATWSGGPAGQVLAHAAALGHPVLPLALPSEGAEAPAGDPYREADDDLCGCHLHVLALSFTHPRTGEAIDVSLDPPAWARAAQDA